MKYIAFDTETTGLSYNKDRLIEFAAVIVEDDEIIDSYSVRIDPVIKVGAGAFKVHGISNEMLKDEPTFDKIAYDIVDYMCLAECSIAHNARFDINFIYHSILRMGDKELLKEFEELVILDTQTYSRKKYNSGRHSLDALADRLGADRTSREDWHGALVDSELLANVVILIEDKDQITTKYAKDWVSKKK